MECKNCRGFCIKKGYQNRKQRYYCKSCKLYQLKTYRYKQCSSKDERMIIQLNNEGVGISGISRLTGVSKAHVVNKIKQLANKIKAPMLQEEHQEYEMDELYTYIKNKTAAYYIIYAINKKTKQVIDLCVGKRTKENLSKVVSKLTKLKPKQIFTDRLNSYPSLIAKPIHTTKAYMINHIEWFNLNLRTHLKRLNRKTICYSKSIEMLESCVKLYIWNKQYYL